MDNQTTVFLALMALMLLGVIYVIYRFVQSVKAKRAYDSEELPDLYEASIEDEVLPDIEESGFSALEDDFSSREESASDIYREISEANDRNGR